MRLWQASPSEDETSGSWRLTSRIGGFALALLFLGVPAAWSSEDKKELDAPALGFDLGLTELDSDAASHSGFRLSLRGGYHVTDRFELEFQYTNTDDNEADENARLWAVFLNSIINLRPRGSATPYLLFGGGQGKAEFGNSERKGGILQIAAGSRFSLGDSERVALRLEASAQRQGVPGSNGRTHLSLTSGLTWQPGRRSGAIAGRVGSRDGDRPLAGVQARLSSAGQEIASAVSDAGGGFRFEGLEEGGYEVSLDLATVPSDHWIGAAAAVAAVEVAAGETAVLELTAAPKDRVAVTVLESSREIDVRVTVDADGDGEADIEETPAGAINVALLKNNEQLATASTDAGGGVSFGRQAPGTYSVEATTVGLPTERYLIDETFTRKVFVVPYELGIAVTENGRSVSGTVRVDENSDGITEETERGLSGVGVGIATDGERVGTAVSSDDGSFGFGSQSPGRYLVSILGSALPDGYRGGEGMSAVAIVIPFSVGLLAQPLGEDIVGRLWIDADEDGRPDALMRVPGVGISLAAGGRPISGTVTDATGGFRLSSEGPGRYAVSIDEGSVPRGYRVGSGMSPLYVSVTPKAAVAMRVSESEGTISGELWVDVDGDAQRSGEEPPIQDAEVKISQQGQLLAAVRTGAGGGFSLEKQEPGRYRIDISEDTLPAATRVGPGSSPQFAQVREPARSSIAVRVWADEDFDGAVQAEERGFAGVAVELRRDRIVVATNHTGADGSLVFEDLDPGEYVARIDPATVGEFYRIGMGALPKRVSLARGQDGLAAFPLRAEQIIRLRWIPWVIVFILTVYLLVHLLLRKRRYGRMLAPCFIPWPPGDRHKTAVLLQDLKEMNRPGGRKTLEQLNAIRGKLGKLTCARSEIVIELFLSHRGVHGWSEMYDMVKEMSPALAASALVLQQKAFALNRDGRDKEAEKILTELRAKEGPSPETNGILGRVYKDRWAAQPDESQLRKSLETYLEGHASDPSDPYPGINALTLMESFAAPPPEREQLLGEVQRAVESRKAKPGPDYWDSATRLELAVLTGDEGAARAALQTARASAVDIWQLETTLGNLKLIQTARDRHKRAIPDWVREVVAGLEAVMAG